ncbi:MAG: hypothetical protein MJ120_03970 [Clostridia bacterium]|nr:hypothetical protein [Clostridia bacterium]
MKKKIGLISAIVAVLVVAVVLIQIITPGFLWIFTPKAKAQNGVIDSVDGIEHISDVPKGEIRYLINNNVIFKKGSAKGDFMFENPAACEYTLQFSVYEVVGENGKENLLYTSPMVAPGQFVLNDKLSGKMPNGFYNCIYIARAYKNGEYAGERSGEMTITVLN